MADLNFTTNWGEHLQGKTLAIRSEAFGRQPGHKHIRVDWGGGGDGRVLRATVNSNRGTGPGEARWGLMPCAHGDHAHVCVNLTYVSVALFPFFSCYWIICTGGTWSQTTWIQIFALLLLNKCLTSPWFSCPGCKMRIKIALWIIEMSQYVKDLITKYMAGCKWSVNICCFPVTDTVWDPPSTLVWPQLAGALIYRASLATGLCPPPCEIPHLQGPAQASPSGRVSDSLPFGREGQAWTLVPVTFKIPALLFLSAKLLHASELGFLYKMQLMVTLLGQWVLSAWAIWLGM